MAKKVSDISGKRWNEILNALNNDIPMEKIHPPLKGAEIEIYESGIEEKKIMLERTGHPLIYETVEIEYDDPCLDIYNTTAEEMSAKMKK